MTGGPARADVAGDPRTGLLTTPGSFDVVAERLRDDPDGTFRVVRNLDTGLIQLLPVPTREENDAYYAARRAAAERVRSSRPRADQTHYGPDKRRQWERVAPLVPRGGRLLDVGCGYGTTLGLAASAGVDVTGVEMPGPAVEIASSRGIRVVAGDLSRGPVLDPAESPFDVILMSHVLEHLLEPVAFLERVRPMLADGGTVVVEVPNAADAMLDAESAYRAFAWQRAHVAYFDPQTLGRRCGSADSGTVDVTGRQRFGSGASSTG